MKAQQPLLTANECAVRRASNILMAFEYPSSSGPFARTERAQILRFYTRNGMLYSSELRKHILSLSTITERVDIRALRKIAREVFDCSAMVAGLIRELIHDLLVMKSTFSRDRLPNENNAYYDKLYLRQPYPVSNNIYWRTGVPIE